jgi:hypothetical protein
LTTLTPALDKQTIKRVAVPFHPRITNKLQAVFTKHQIKMVHSTRCKLGELLGNPKDQVETLQKSGIYQIDCLGCSASYIGQSRRSIIARFNDHHRNIRKNHPELLSITDLASVLLKAIYANARGLSRWNTKSKFSGKSMFSTLKTKTSSKFVLCINLQV